MNTRETSNIRPRNHGFGAARDHRKSSNATLIARRRCGGGSCSRESHPFLHRAPGGRSTREKEPFCTPPKSHSRCRNDKNKNKQLCYSCKCILNVNCYEMPLLRSPTPGPSLHRFVRSKRDEKAAEKCESVIIDTFE